MQKSFVKGVIVGGLLAASVGMMMNSDMAGARRRMMRNGRNFLRKSGGFINNVVDMFR
ncbi:MAG: YtxH domain-containing protein [Bacillota bacterium]